ncbi:hypothetical protein [Propionicimonas sp.]|uniref:hypothetical protein n=1 Tax=Propionicimonas sp. TaxID=1955623 RepID=UPI0017D16BE2|nr:hypothetical protein [Propionicimonas sp.]MBU3976452.1 hypothetical protein [Actinomycetota bacterium]MBA3020292.1 hypothetical protein [Propionicimonas sp.]MBU3986079.1 hypothetical protein [Actinomycetota bacterium]MBU4007596.1 hypothetical protein [Actinomycetota bacterium]MBU4064377.1 hypothetical protein [Actinomycetota bacterium]
MSGSLKIDPQVRARPKSDDSRGAASAQPRWPLSAVAVLLGLAAALIAAATSVLGLAAPWPYAAETADWQLQARGQDLGNLLAVVVLLSSLPLLRRTRGAGLQLWVGSLLYLAYAFVIYAAGVHFGPLFLPYVAALGAASYALILALTSGALARIVVPRRASSLSAWVVGLIGVAFALLWLSSIISDTLAGRTPAALELIGLPTNLVHVLDLALVIPAMLIAAFGVRRQGTAPILGAWLVFSVLMSASIVATLLLSAAPLAVVAALGSITAASAVAAVVQFRAQASGVGQPDVGTAEHP